MLLMNLDQLLQRLSQVSQDTISENQSTFSDTINLINMYLHKIKLCAIYAQTKSYFDKLMQIQEAVSHILFIKEIELPIPLDIFRYDCERLDDELTRRYLFIKIRLACYSILPDMPEECPVTNLNSVKHEPIDNSSDLETITKQYPTKLFFDNWKETLLDLRNNNKWDHAISYMISAVQNDSNDIDRWLFAQETIITTLLDQEYDESFFYTYARIALHLFKESYKRFNQNAEYLFFSGYILYRVTWFVGITNKETNDWRKSAYSLEPDNTIYAWYYYVYCSEKDAIQLITLKKYIDSLSFEHIAAKQLLDNKKYIGERIWNNLLYSSQYIIARQSSSEN